VTGHEVRARALISIGTNSTRLLVLRGDELVAAQSTGTRLGTGLDASGALDPQARERTLGVIAEYVARITRADATIDVIATSALRRASDAQAFSAAVQTLTGVDPRVLSGDEEATYSFLGATYGNTSAATVGVLDVGGGSTELAVGNATGVERTLSLEIGAVRLSERHPALLGARALDEAARKTLTQTAREDARSVLAPLGALRGFERLLAVGGTVFTASAMIANDETQRDGAGFSRTQRIELIDALLAQSLAQRRTMAHIRPQRADILPAGLIVVDEACLQLGIDTLYVSYADLLAGYLRSPAYRGIVHCK
jgi:exopolyphosphatase/guanosine-5'-triphosphate,3'-diphosphate pyrophosphatase